MINPGEKTVIAGTVVEDVALEGPDAGGLGAPPGPGNATGGSAAGADQGFIVGRAAGGGGPSMSAARCACPRPAHRRSAAAETARGACAMRAAHVAVHSQL